MRVPSGTRIEGQIKSLETSLKRGLRRHLEAAGMALVPPVNGIPDVSGDKVAIRWRHSQHRAEKLKNADNFIVSNLPNLLRFFASGREVDPVRIRPRLELVASGTTASSLFRLASLTWSVPVSEGYGRRMRFVVWDDNNGKLIGIIALTDPVFNLLVRDNLIGWSAEDRKARLVHMMDANVLGAVPPYSTILCGKLIACLVRTAEVVESFRSRYANSKGVISHKKKHPQLVLVTTTSALGRSSMYNRLRIGDYNYFEPLGYTSGFGHFHVPQSLFESMREYLRLRGHRYGDGNRFGNGPNWKFRTIRAALELIGVRRDLLQHGIQREVYVSRIAPNCIPFLRGEVARPDFGGVLSVNELSELALERWVRPRAHRRPDFAEWDKSGIKELLKG